MARIFVLDDSEDILAIMKVTLAYFKHETVLARDGLEAVELLKQHPEMELIITDLEVPNISGEAFIKLVRAMDSHRNTPILVLSANAERMRGHGDVAGVVVKPFTPLSLKAAVDAALARRT